jgi:mannose-1-phosphate guanylyltransferase
MELSDLKPQIVAMYQSISGESIDYGVMERADNVVVVPCSFGWSDVGSWSALPEMIENDGDGNVVINAQDPCDRRFRKCVFPAEARSSRCRRAGSGHSEHRRCPSRLPHGAGREVKKIVEELQRRDLREHL